MGKEKNPAILFLRIISTIFIVLCHTLHYYTFIPLHSRLGIIFNVGVFVFLLISGYLYGNKEIGKFSNFIFKRWQKVVLPGLVLFGLNYIILLIFANGIPLLDTILHLTNLQGLIFINSKLLILMPKTTSLGPLWFNTIIMICYACIPLFEKAQNRINNSKNKTLLQYGIILLLLILSAVLFIFSSTLIIYYITFYIGYVLGNNKYNEKTLKIPHYSILTFITVILLGLRLYLSDKTVDTDIYEVFVSLQQTTFALWLFMSAFVFVKLLTKFSNDLGKNKFLNWFDSNSIYIFLSHCVFCTTSETNVFTLIDNIWLATIAFIVCTLTLGIVVKYISIWLNKLIDYSVLKLAKKKA